MCVPLQCDRPGVIVAVRQLCCNSGFEREEWLKSKTKIKKLKPSPPLSACCVDLDYTVQKIIHALRQRTPAKLSGNAEFLCTAAQAQSDIKDILSRNIPYLNNEPAAQKPLMPAGRS